MGSLSIHIFVVSVLPQVPQDNVVDSGASIVVSIEMVLW